MRYLSLILWITMLALSLVVTIIGGISILLLILASLLILVGPVGATILGGLACMLTTVKIMDNWGDTNGRKL